MKSYSVQLYSIRDRMPTDPEGVLRTLAAMGYKSVEFAGFFGHPAKTVRGWLDACGLTCSGTHTGIGELTDRFEETVAYHQAIGCRNIIIPGADLSTADKLNAFIGQVNDLIPRLAERGITLGYHNHSHEFLPNSSGQIIHTELERRTEIEFEIDTYWAYHAGVDPIALMERLKDRIRVIHIKDGLADGTGKPLCMGTAPVRAVHETAERLGFLQVVESETLSPDGLTEAALCLGALAGLDALSTAAPADRATV